MSIDTIQDVERAVERLRRRDPESLARFILSLAQDAGPIGEQVRTFIVGDDLAAVTESLRERLRSSEGASEYQHRHARGREMGQSLGFILDSIESWVLPADAAAAFELLVSFFEGDARAMENCFEHHDSVQCAFERAAVLMGKAAPSLPRTEVEEKLKALAANDAYGVRRTLRDVIRVANNPDLT